MIWKPIETAPKERPFLVGTKSGGILLEAWIWCPDTSEFHGCLSQTPLSAMPISETYFWHELPSPVVSN